MTPVICSGSDGLYQGGDLAGGSIRGKAAMALEFQLKSGAQGGQERGDSVIINRYRMTGEAAGAKRSEV